MWKNATLSFIKKSDKIISIFQFKFLSIWQLLYIYQLEEYILIKYIEKCLRMIR